MGLTLEVCVDTGAGLDEAVAGGADRIELCAALALGGLTPAAGLMAQAAGCPLPVMVMIRPRAGDFVWAEAEVGMMEAEIAATRAAGLAGVVLGTSLPDGRLDVPVLKRLVAAAEGMDLTLHRAIDLAPDMGQALEAVIGLGFRRVLTSGGEKTAEAGAARIAAVVTQATGRISIMPGFGGVPGKCADAERAWYCRTSRVMLDLAPGNGQGGGIGVRDGNGPANLGQAGSGVASGFGLKEASRQVSGTGG